MAFILLLLSTSLQVRRHPLDNIPERALLPRLHRRVARVATHRKPMPAAKPVVPLVPRRKLPTTKNLIRLRLRLRRKRAVDLAALDEERHARLRVSLNVGGDLETRGVDGGRALDDAVEGEVEDVAGCGEGWMSERGYGGGWDGCAPPKQ